MSQHLHKFQELLRELFQFDCADLDFGIYRIMNHKRDIIEQFIMEKLPKLVADELSTGMLAEHARIAEELEKVAVQIKDMMGQNAVDGDGNLDPKWSETPAGAKYNRLKARLAGGQDRAGTEATVFNHLYNFFSRYYEDGDFISKRRYSKRERYAIPYNGEEVHLHWANKDQYYVKTGEHFRNYTFRSRDVTVQFKVMDADVEQNNVKGEKRYFLPRYEEVCWNEETGAVLIPFDFRPMSASEQAENGKNHLQEAIIRQAVAEIPKRLAGAAPALAALTAERHRNGDDPITFLEYHLRQYTRRNTSDFFIHKDLKRFLTRELDFYLKNEVVQLDGLETGSEAQAESWFQTFRLLKLAGGQIIDLLDQIESFQKMIWEKRKFVTDVEYWITVGGINEMWYPQIASCEPQWREWRDLLSIDEQEPHLFDSTSSSEGRVRFLIEHPTLTLDTKHFDRHFVDQLVADVDNLEEQVDGLLLESDNFQALSILCRLYGERIGCVYLDPPYNTDASPILYKNGYKSSSWVSLMDCRLRATRRLMDSNGVLAVAIDDEQQRELSFLLSSIFDDRLLGTMAVRSNPSGRPTQTGYSVSHEYLLFAGQGPGSAIGRLPPTPAQLARFSQQDGQGVFEWRNLRREGSNSDRSARPGLYYPIYITQTSIRVPPMTWQEEESEWRIDEEPASGESVVWPVNDESEQKTWRWEWKKTMDSLVELSVRKNRAGDAYVYYKRRPHEEGVATASCWFDAKYSATEHGTALLKDMFSKSEFPYPKSIHAVSDALLTSGASAPDKIVLDYFAGSGTTGHAVINLNRRDGGRRKFVLAEVGQYFQSILVPRLKKAIFAPDWRDGKPVRSALKEEAARSPRIIKYIRLESYEDALNNIEFDDTGVQTAMLLEDYVIQYMLKWETKNSATLLNVEALERPFDYQLVTHANGNAGTAKADVAETFNYLIGLRVKTRKVHHDDGRRYLVYRGNVDNREVVVIWRETEAWEKADYVRDKEFVAKHKLTDGADEAFVNGASLIRSAKALEPLFNERMFEPLE